MIYACIALFKFALKLEDMYIYTLEFTLTLIFAKYHRYLPTNDITYGIFSNQYIHYSKYLNLDHCIVSTTRFASEESRERSLDKKVLKWIDTMS